MTGGPGNPAGRQNRGASEDSALVFGMGERGLVAPDFPPLTTGEVKSVLGESGQCGGSAEIEWRSRRPLSAAARVRCDDGRRVVVKRMPATLRDLPALASEHAFMAHVRDRGIPVPHVRAVARDGFSYEIQELGVGEDRYRDEFSWSPYHSVAEAAAGGAMLARLHLASSGFDAPVRAPRPLLAALCTDPVETIENYAAARPPVGRFLAQQDWRRAWAPLAARGPVSDLGERVDALPALWTHDDWHPTNLLWSGTEITAVLDFGLANRTVAVFDIATAVERFALDWLAPAGTGVVVHTDQLSAFLRGYCAIRPLDARERDVLPELFPLVHIAYELSEIDYFLTIPPSRRVRDARIAYRNYFLGRSEWAASAEGKAFTTTLRRLTTECC